MKKNVLVLTSIFLTVLAAGSPAFPADPPSPDEVLIPAGEFRMGTEDGTAAERPVHRVWLDAFYLDRTEVSNAEYRTFDPGHRPGSASTCDACPVTRVTWFEAQAFCQHRGQRLPTEAEWEKAARGPESWDYSFAPQADPRRGRFGAPFGEGPLPVDSLSPNGYGVHHLSGNVWEWVRDWFDPSYYAKSPRRNPPGSAAGFRKGVRGGGWYNPAYYVHAGLRFRLEPHVRLSSLGFRCARAARPLP